MTPAIELPRIPVRHDEIVDYIAANPGTPLTEIMAPYREYESRLRTIFAQDRDDPRLNDPCINVVPLFNDKTARITTRARDLASESHEEKERYIMALPEDKRRPHGSPATVSSLKEFRKNFGIFSENSLADLDWSNVVAAGSSVVNCLLPVPAEFTSSKRKLREYYHEKFCPASDVDLFLYGLNEEEAIEKIKQIEQAVRDSILSEITVVRSKYAITIASQYPTRHVQIVLRSYKSVSEILTGFDIDSAGGAYDGNQVYVTPRALGSFITQINHIDLSRRSPSYENRLSKYSHRNFEVYWPELDRKKIDPTIFERSFQRTLGLARLLVLERLPTQGARELYLNKRRQERGRPAAYNSRVRLAGNIKDDHEDEVADWISEAEVSNYHTFTVPYGKQFYAKKIEKLCYTRDLLLNAEWNQENARDVYLHRHPAFFGRVEDVIKDCCGYCPEPITPEEKEAAEKDAQIYIQGDMKLIIDDPGRQQIGSFNPLTEDDWTDMAYVGNTARLCQSIVDSDVDEVLGWLSQPEADPNRRDYTGRTPLQLAVMCSTPEVVKCFVDHGARLTARMADGKTALHLAAERGSPEIIKLLMEKSISNEELEGDKEDKKRRLIRGSGQAESSFSFGAKDEDEDAEMTQDGDDGNDEDSDVDMVDEEESDDGVHSFATGSFVKVKSGEKDDTTELEDVDEGEPDFYKIDALAWDVPSSPLHLAIACGHEDVVRTLCDYGGDALLPVKFIRRGEAVGAILTLCLGLKLPLEKAVSMAKLLLSLGATCSQADMDGWTALHRYVQSAPAQLVDVLLDHDKMGVKVAINHLTFAQHYWGLASSPLHAAISRGDLSLVLSLINAGARVETDFETWLKAAKMSAGTKRLSTFEQNQHTYRSNKLSPLFVALSHSTNVDLALELLDRGADPNEMSSQTYSIFRDNYSQRYTKGETVLDRVQDAIGHLRAYEGAQSVKPSLRPGLDEALAGYMEGTYQHWVVSKDVVDIKKRHRDDVEKYEKAKCAARAKNDQTLAAQMAAVKGTIAGLVKLKKLLVSKGAKTFAELHPKYVKDNPTLYSKKKKGHGVVNPYEPGFKFFKIYDLTDARRAAYIELFEAAWEGDLEKIKSLTLHPWGEDQTEPPLQIVVDDNHANTPWSLAFFKGHYDVAWAILEIAHAQHSPPGEERKVYQIDGGHTDDGDSDSELCSENDSEDGPHVVSKTVDKKFTIDNIGEISMQVKSQYKPLQVLLKFMQNTFEVKEGVADINTCSKCCVWDFFLNGGGDDQMVAFKQFLDMCLHFSSRKYEETPGVEYFYHPFVVKEEFNRIVEDGNVKMLRELIRRGYGFPLDHLVKGSGIEASSNRKPRYYPGLTVYGKKRKDWATAGQRMYLKPNGARSPPLLHAASHGQREMVGWLLSEEPLKLYKEFSKSKMADEDPRLQDLKALPSRFEAMVSKWLGDRNELVLHCAVMAEETEESIGLVKNLLKTYPAALEARDTNNNTPLLTAAYLGRQKFMKLLIKAGADESVRNKSGENMIHRLTYKVVDATEFKTALDLMDEDLRAHLFKQRTTLDSGGMTPLHSLCERLAGSWAWSYDGLNSEDHEAIVKLLLEYSKGVEIDMLNAAGDSVLHTTVMQSSSWLSQVLVDFHPKLLYRENAVGRTPAELAYHMFLAQIFVEPNNRGTYGKCRNPEGLLSTVRAEAVPAPPKKHQKNPDKVWELCRAKLEENPDKRRLVSLYEANDVAKRLGEKYTSSRYFSTRRIADDDDENSETAEPEEVVDLVGQWTGNLDNTAWDRQKKRDEERKAREAREESCGECGHKHLPEDEEYDGTNFDRYVETDSDDDSNLDDGGDSDNEAMNSDDEGSDGEDTD